jgi:hypothetical protein
MVGYDVVFEKIKGWCKVILVVYCFDVVVGEDFSKLGGASSDAVVVVVQGG